MHRRCGCDGRQRCRSSRVPDRHRGILRGRALSTGFNDEPRSASRPWDRRRDGFVMGEGSGVIMLEEYGHAQQRGARIYAELTGNGLSGDGFHIAAPQEDGNGAVRAMSTAIRRTGVMPDAMDYVSVHATSTQAGDEIELRAIGEVFGTHVTRDLSVSSTRFAMGQLLGASGAVEAITSTLALRDQIAPPTLNLTDLPADCPAIDLVPAHGKGTPYRLCIVQLVWFWWNQRGARICATTLSHSRIVSPASSGACLRIDI